MVALTAGRWTPGPWTPPAGWRSEARLGSRRRLHRHPGGLRRRSRHERRPSNALRARTEGGARYVHACACAYVCSCMHALARWGSVRAPMSWCCLSLTRCLTLCLTLTLTRCLTRCLTLYLARCLTLCPRYPCRYACRAPGHRQPPNARAGRLDRGCVYLYEYSMHICIHTRSSWSPRRGVRIHVCI